MSDAWEELRKAVAHAKTSPRQALLDRPCPKCAKLPASLYRPGHHVYLRPEDPGFNEVDGNPVNYIPHDYVLLECGCGHIWKVDVPNHAPGPVPCGATNCWCEGPFDLPGRYYFQVAKERCGA